MPSATDHPRRLVLLRHAKAEPGGREADALRSLALAGRRQCLRVGGALIERDLVPDLVLCSAAVRTRQTWDLVRGALGGAEPVVEISDLLYEAGVAEMVGQVRGIGDGVRTVLVVGHEPTVSAVAATLAGAHSDKSAVAHVRAGMSTGTFCVLDVAGPWSELERGAARLRAVVAPTG
ncbi:SixA phosphatase family protein [Pengzhenrongella frigida]|uniref:Histidine phosphatase family protein n=1 Tax=Pengzhenrongella frigida TaxID=1259133 RepID=A0A4Q5MY20_9MICO|nr:histidine phosphatase family protein [Cellulomonas sp. HLT2-17]RYV50540.1 histidine phosphatase family protein [Cellulomonas sp. HLT2-17]